MELGDAPKDAVGAGTAPTVTVTVFVTAPSMLEHLRVYVVVTVGVTVTEPMVLIVPLYGLSVHDVAPDEVQVSLEVWPEVMDVGLATIDAVGAAVTGLTVTCAVLVTEVPALFTHLSV
jgi:hypothetical protein